MENLNIIRSETPPKDTSSLWVKSELKSGLDYLYSFQSNGWTPFFLKYDPLVEEIKHEIGLLAHNLQVITDLSISNEERIVVLEDNLVLAKDLL